MLRLREAAFAFPEGTLRVRPLLLLLLLDRWGRGGIASVAQGPGHFVAGTVIGSNVANILFILGAAALAGRGAYRAGPGNRVSQRQ